MAKSYHCGISRNMYDGDTPHCPGLLLSRATVRGLSCRQSILGWSMCSILMFCTSPLDHEDEPLGPRFRFAAGLIPEELAQWRNGKEKMRGPVTKREETVQDKTQGADEGVASVQRDQHIESRAWEAWDEHGPVGGDGYGCDEVRKTISILA